MMEAATLFSPERQAYAFGELDELGKANLAAFASVSGFSSSSCRSKVGCTSCARRAGDLDSALAGCSAKRGGMAVCGAGAAKRASPVVGILVALGAPSPESPIAEAFRAGLAEGGFIEGRNLSIEYRWVRGNFRQVADFAAELPAAGRATDPSEAWSPPSVWVH
jgi:hypothetical protein